MHSSTCTLHIHVQSSSSYIHARVYVRLRTTRSTALDDELDESVIDMTIEEDIDVAFEDDDL